jgi:hypothetical protein
MGKEKFIIKIIKLKIRAILFKINMRGVENIFMKMANIILVNG